MFTAAIEHLGCLPQRANLSSGEWVQLLGFHRLQRKSYDKCPECTARMRGEAKTCFVCGREYHEDDRGRGASAMPPGLVPAQEQDFFVKDAIQRAMGGTAITTAHTMKKDRAEKGDTKEEQKAKIKARMREDGLIRD